MNDLLAGVNKLDPTLSLTRETLKDVLDYYKKLNVVYFDNSDDTVMWL